MLMEFSGMLESKPSHENRSWKRKESIKRNKNIEQAKDRKWSAVPFALLKRRNRYEAVGQMSCRMYSCYSIPPTMVWGQNYAEGLILS